MKSTFETLINDLKEKHKLALNWFHKNKNKKFKGWLPVLEENVLLASKAKGIYKPKSLSYALSIRISKNNYYDDQFTFENDKIKLKYFQENKNIKERDLEYTNIGLKKCMKEKIPIGVFVQEEKKPNSLYKVIGTGLIQKWENGYYFVDIFDDRGEL